MAKVRDRFNGIDLYFINRFDLTFKGQVEVNSVITDVMTDVLTEINYN